MESFDKSFGVVLAYVLCAFAQARGGEVTTSSPFDHLTAEYRMAKGRSVFVFDGVLPEHNIAGLQTFLSANDNWRYVLHDPLASSAEHGLDDKNGIPWKSWSDPGALKATVVGSALKKLVEAADSKDNNGRKSRFEMNEIYSALLRRGDRTKIHRETVANEDSYTVVIFINIVWRKNAYGELFFYDEDGEIMACIKPKFARIVVWHSSVPYLFRPPSIAQLTTQSVLFVQFSSNVEKNYQKLENYKNFQVKQRDPPAVNSWLSEFPANIYAEKDIRDHLTTLRRNRKGHFVAVFDDLFKPATLDKLRSWVIKYGKFYFDGSLDVSSDNVQWISGINVGDFIQTQFWPTIRQIAKYVSNSSQWYPYDVACNLIRNYDHTRFHLDTSHAKEKEMTFLLYLSPNWTAADYGETAFMEKNNDDIENEYVAEVVPTFGRAVIFDGNFPHSAHPPSVTHPSARYTLAVKLSYTKMLAVRKTFEEESRHEPMIMHSLSGIRKLVVSPESSVAMQKVMSVAEHLGARNLQLRFLKQEGKNGFDDEEFENDGESLVELQSALHMNEEMEELWPTLTQDQQRTLEKMMKHHSLGEKLTSENADNESQDLDLGIFDPQRRDFTIKKWKKMTSKNADDLDDYLELYLRQRIWMKEDAARKMISLL